MKIGIIAAPKAYKRRFFLREIFRIIKVEEVKSAANPFELVVGSLPFSEEKMKKMSARKAERLLLDAKNRLERLGAEDIVCCGFLKNLCREKEILSDMAADDRGDRLFLMMMPICIRETAKKCGTNLLDTSVCIRTDKAGRISEYLMQSLCFDTKNIVLCTRNKEQAQKICDRFFEETGLLVRNVGFEESPGGIVIDTEKGCVSFGRDLFVSEVDMGFDLFGYSVKHQEIAALLKDYKPHTLEWKYSYKSGD